MKRKIDKTFGIKESGKSYFDREGAYIIFENDGFIGVVKTPKGYFLPGGGIEEKESCHACIKRECMEELGYDVQIVRYLCSAEIYTTHQKLGYFHPIQHYFHGKLKRKAADPVEEFHEFVWLDPAKEIDKMFADAQKWAIQRYLENKV